MLFGIALISFLILSLAPGDPAQIMSQEGATQEQIDHLREQMGLDRPLVVQFGIYLKNALTGDLGDSVFSHRPVLTMIGDRLPLTLELALGGIIWATLLAIPIGTIAAMKSGSLLDLGVTTVSLLGVATPAFWRGLILILTFAIWAPLFPISGTAPPGSGLFEQFKHLFLPWVSVGLTSFGVITRVVRASVLEQLNQDHTTTARAKGLSQQVVMSRHVVRNALIPIVTVVGLQLVGLLSGAVLTEMVFGLPGIGQMVVTAITRRDYAVVQGTLIVVGVVFVVVNLLIDLIYAVIDPRVRYA
jgi:peptide/nickel transport system permease protein